MFLQYIITVTTMTMEKLQNILYFEALSYR